MVVVSQGVVVVVDLLVVVSLDVVFEVVGDDEGVLEGLELGLELE